MTRDEFDAFVEETIFPRIRAFREAGQREYANTESAFSNFESLEKELGLTREQVLWVYAMKHKDGIASHLRGNVSQREDVRGRIADLIVYLMLLWGMVEEGERARESERRLQLTRDVFPG